MDQVLSVQAQLLDDQEKHRLRYLCSVQALLLQQKMSRNKPSFVYEVFMNVYKNKVPFNINIFMVYTNEKKRIYFIETVLFKFNRPHQIQ